MKGYIKYKTEYSDFSKLRVRARKDKLDIFDIELEDIMPIFNEHYYIERFYDPKRNETYFWVYESIVPVDLECNTLYRLMSGSIIKYDGFVTVNEASTSAAFTSALCKIHDWYRAQPKAENVKVS